MSPRLATGVVVSALIRRVDAEGGAAVVLARGDRDAGGILIVARERGANPRLFERGLGPDGRTELLRTGPDSPDEADLAQYLERRRARDPDLWIIELDIAAAERFAAETIVGR